MSALTRFPRNRQLRDEDEYPILHGDWSLCSEIWRKGWIPGPAGQQVCSIGSASSSTRSGDSTKDDVDPSQQQLQLGSREFSDSVCEGALVDGHDLRYVRNRVFRESCDAWQEADVARCVGPAKIACDGDANYRSNPTPVEIVALNYNDRFAKARSGPSRRSQVSPPDFSLPDHHPDRSKTLRLAVLVKSSGSVLTSSQTRFIVSVTSSPA